MTVSNQHIWSTRLFLPLILCKILIFSTRSDLSIHSPLHFTNNFILPLGQGRNFSTLPWRLVIKKIKRTVLFFLNYTVFLGNKIVSIVDYILF
jgi:hypothetical protein